MASGLLSRKSDDSVIDLTLRPVVGVVNGNLFSLEQACCVATLHDLKHKKTPQ